MAGPLVSAQALADAAWAALAAATLALVGLSHRRGARLERLGALVRRPTAPRAVALVVLVAWMWVGWHFFAR